MENNVIGKFCSSAEKDTIIYPKEIPGYTAPDGQILTEDNQQFNFIYTPIEYDITYDLNGGTINEDLKSLYTIEDTEYIPPVPTKKNYVFDGWTPKTIPAHTIGNIHFVASWKALPVLKTGKELNDIFNAIANGKENILGFKIKNHIDDATIPNAYSYVNISSSDTPIYAFFDSGVIYLICEDAIHCNSDMSSAFEGMSSLIDIDNFESIVAENNMNLNSAFKNCRSLSDVQSLEYWDYEKSFGDITDCFLGTNALDAGRTPSWYIWEVNIKYISSTGKVLKIDTANKRPGEVVYPIGFDGYKAETVSNIINEKDTIYTFVYTPIEYSIRYNLNGGTLQFAKTTYNIEENNFYPAEPVKDGYKFTSWDPEYIPSGNTGNYNFIANYILDN